ncbi:hypothetical protein KR059_002094 [Drosophila kikkawai]|nr:hypothetical protein KR059_002094 [Drosophila kikkawai]
MKIYKQKLREVWLQMDEFRQWLRRDPDDSYRAHCRYCKCCVNTKISDLRAHAATKKHMKQIDAEGQLVTTTISPAVSNYQRGPKKTPGPKVKKEPTVKKERKSTDPPVDYEQIIENLALYETEQVMFSNVPLNDTIEQEFQEECEVEGECDADGGDGGQMSVVSVVDEEMVNKAVASALSVQRDSSQVFGDFVADRLRQLNNDAAEFAKDKIMKVILEAASIDRAPTYS